MIVNESKTEPAELVTVPDEAVATAYRIALRVARKQAHGDTLTEDALIDAATSGVIWAAKHCRCLATWPLFVREVVEKFLWRAREKLKLKAARRPECASLEPELLAEAVAQRETKPAAPLLIEDLPEDLAFIVRLYMIDGFNLREIGLLTGQSHNTVDMKLKRAAELLAGGRLDKPERRKGEKRLTAR